MSEVPKLVYSKLEILKDNLIFPIIESLPEILKADIYPYNSDIFNLKARLLGRLILISELKKSGKLPLLRQYSRNKNNKPTICEWYNFSFSYSSEYVTMALSNDIIGVDIEKICEIDFEDFYEFLHPSELIYIGQSRCSLKSFFWIWTRKESLLKATELGMHSQMSSLCCLKDKIAFKKNALYLEQVEFDVNYTAHICTDIENKRILVEKFSLTDVLYLLKNKYNCEY